MYAVLPAGGWLRWLGRWFGGVFCYTRLGRSVVTRFVGGGGSSAVHRPWAGVTAVFCCWQVSPGVNRLQRVEWRRTAAGGGRFPLYTGLIAPVG